MYWLISLITTAVSILPMVSYAQQACAPAERQAAVDAATELRDLIVVDMHKRGVSKMVHDFRQQLETCNIPLSQFGLGKGALSVWERTGDQSTLKNLEYAVQNNSYFEDVRDWEIMYRKLKQKLGEKMTSEEDKMLNSAVLRGSTAASRINSSCKPVDFREKLGPVRNQDSVGWCYAYAAADLVSFYTNEKISAAELAIQHNKYNKGFYDLRKDWFGAAEDEFSGGTEKAALDKAIDRGLCLEKDFPSEDNSGVGILEIIRSYENNYRENKSRKPDCDEPHESPVPDTIQGFLTQVTGEVKNSMYTQELADLNCRPRLKTQLEVVEIERKGFDRNEVFSTINAQLDKNEPVSIWYASSILRENRMNLSGSHASLVVARRSNSKTGECEYLLRNSWGPSCLYYGKRECEDGHIWLPAKDLYRSTYGATYIKK